MMQRKAEVKTPVAKAAEAKETVKKTEEKPPIVKALESKAAEVMDVIEKKMDTKPELTKAETKTVVTPVEKKELPKKAEKKIAPKKEKAEKTEKAAVVPELIVQYDGSEANIADVLSRAKALYVAEGHREGAIKSIQVYIKPEEQAAYYVINKKNTGRVDLF